MKNEISFDEYRKISLEGLKFFVKLCERYNLRYFLAYGTLLGAVRHNGFIPWDDDIDIFMPRDDYERFLAMDGCGNKNIRWTVLNPIKQNDYCYYWTKISHRDSMIYPCRFNNGFMYGVSIDIFPLDYIDSITIDEARNILSTLRDKYNKCMWNTRINAISSPGIKGRINSIIRKGIYTLFSKHLDKPQHVISQFQTEFNNISSSTGEYCYYPLDIYNTVWKADWFKNDTKINFEDIMCSVPVGYDELLKEIYGDYMQLPPKEKQVCNHSYKAYYI